MSTKNILPLFKEFETLDKSTYRGRIRSIWSKRSGFYLALRYENILKKH
ncbi:hypothetical protein ES705_10714 [subsurface metagenome]|jgi:hypothetical protein